MSEPAFSLPATSSVQNIAVLGSYVPRRCGIATFTNDLVENLSAVNSRVAVSVLAMDDDVAHEYPAKVKHRIPEGDLAAYVDAAHYINDQNFDILSVQHEFGLFGGEAGSHLLNMLREVNMPIVTTFHTVLRDPQPAQRGVMAELVQLSERVVVMSERGAEFLINVYGVSPDRIDRIPHGIPKFNPERGNNFRETLDIKGPMIMTFGLLSPDKGIQYMIEAMPAIVARHPGAVYVVLGTTHPHVRTSAGESYRDSLVSLAKNLGVEDSVRFVDRFVEIDELVDYLSATDIYVTPYLNPTQVTSGTLAFAVGAGKTVISTPYWYAEELLSESRGVLVPFRDSAALAEAILGVEAQPEEAREMGRRAKEFGSHMQWSQVGRSYLETFERAKIESTERLRTLAKSNVAWTSESNFPEPRLDHLVAMTDDTGMIQHATYSVPNRKEGYCVDDNARALILTTHSNLGRHWESVLRPLQNRYLSFVADAYNEATGRFRNFMSYDRRWLEDHGSEDSQSTALWSLGAVISRSTDRGHRLLAKALFDRSAPAMYETTSPRTWANSVLAADECLCAYPGDQTARTLRYSMMYRLWQLYKNVRRDDWQWFEESLTYANARLSHALILGGARTGEQAVFMAGIESLEWLMQRQTNDKGVFVPIGSNGFGGEPGTHEAFDQQPLEAWVTVSACLAAAKFTKDDSWTVQAKRAYQWFVGENLLGIPLYDPATGGCKDGLQPNGMNENQGAESTLSFLFSWLEITQTKSSHLRINVQNHRL